MRDPFMVSENIKIKSLLKEFQSGRIHMAILLDEYGGTSGSFAIFIMIYPPTYTISIPQLLIPAIAIPAMITRRYAMLTGADGRRVTIIWK